MRGAASLVEIINERKIELYFAESVARYAKFARDEHKTVALLSMMNGETKVAAGHEGEIASAYMYYYLFGASSRYDAETLKRWTLYLNHIPPFSLLCTLCDKLPQGTIVFTDMRYLNHADVKDLHEALKKVRERYPLVRFRFLGSDKYFIIRRPSDMPPLAIEGTPLLNYEKTTPLHLDDFDMLGFYNGEREWTSHQNKNERRYILGYMPIVDGIVIGMDKVRSSKTKGKILKEIKK